MLTPQNWFRILHIEDLRHYYRSASSHVNQKCWWLYCALYYQQTHLASLRLCLQLYWAVTNRRRLIGITTLVQPEKLNPMGYSGWTGWFELRKILSFYLIFAKRYKSMNAVFNFCGTILNRKIKNIIQTWVSDKVTKLIPINRLVPKTSLMNSRFLSNRWLKRNIYRYYSVIQSVILYEN